MSSLSFFWEFLPLLRRLLILECVFYKILFSNFLWKVGKGFQVRKRSQRKLKVTVDIISMVLSNIDFRVWFTTVPLKAVSDQALISYSWFSYWKLSIRIFFIYVTLGFMLETHFKQEKQNFSYILISKRWIGNNPC